MRARETAVLKSSGPGMQTVCPRHLSHKSKAEGLRIVGIKCMALDGGTTCPRFPSYIFRRLADALTSLFYKL